MKQFNKTAKYVAAFIILLFCAYQSYAQPSSYYPNKYVRNWRTYQQNLDVSSTGTIGTNIYSNQFVIGSSIYSLFKDTNSYNNTTGNYDNDILPKMWAFNTVANTWNLKTPFPADGRDGAASFVIGNNAYITLGQLEGNGTGVTKGMSDTKLYKYSSVANTWDSLVDFPGLSVSFAQTFTINGKGFIVGGYNIHTGGSLFDNITATYAYDEANNSWSSYDNCPSVIPFNGINTYNSKVFVVGSKAYIVQFNYDAMFLHEFDPNAANGLQWQTKSVPNHQFQLINNAYYATKDGLVIFAGDKITYNVATSWQYSRNDSAYKYDVATDTWSVEYLPLKFTVAGNVPITPVVNNELFVFNPLSPEFDEGYGEVISSISGNTSPYYNAAYASFPFDSIFVHHNFNGVCQNSTPTISYSVNKPMNAGNQFIVVLTRNDGLIVDTLATVTDTVGGSVQITIPTINGVVAKLNSLSIDPSTFDFGKLKIAVLTTSPRTIIANQSKAFSLLDDPAGFLLNARGNSQSNCESNTPLSLQFVALENAVTYPSFMQITEGLKINWYYGSTVNLPTNDTTKIVYAKDTASTFIDAGLRIDYDVFCYGIDTTISYSSYLNAGKITNNYLPTDIGVVEGNSLCSNNETKHIITKIGEYYLYDTSMVNVKLFKNSALIADNNIMLDQYTYSGELYFNKIDTITVTGINDGDTIRMEYTGHADKCDTSSRGTVVRSVVFHQYTNSLKKDINLDLRFSNNLLDSSNKQNNASGQNIFLTADRFGVPNKAIYFPLNASVTNTSEVVTTNNVDISNKDPRTISFWFKTDSLGYNYYTPSNPITPSLPAVLGFGSLATNGAANFIHIRPQYKSIVFRGNFSDLNTTSNIFKFNEWTHVAFTFDGIFGNLYVNGKCAASNKFLPSFINNSFDYTYSTTNHPVHTLISVSENLNTTNSPLRIGNDGNGVDMNSDYKYPYHGGVDDILIYNKAMTACQIDSLYKMAESNCTPISSTINAAICAGGFYRFNNVNRTAAGTYNDTLVNAVGCDSVVTLHLTIIQKSSSTINRTFCDNSSYIFNGVMLNTVGTFYDTLINAAGCDSIITLNLTRAYPSSHTDIIEKCSSELPIVWNGTTYNNYGNYTKSFTNAAGCDSTAYLDLRKPNVIVGTPVNITVCSNQLPYWFNGVPYTYTNLFASPGLQTAQGCDSTAYLNLTVKQTSSKTINDTILSNQTYSFNGNIYNITGTYTGTFTNAAGCDSVVTLHLYVKQAATPIAGSLIGCSFIVTNSLSNATGGGAWRSSNTSVATINQYGVVTNKANGTTTITYQYVKNNVQYVATVLYKVAVAQTPNAITGSNVLCVDNTTNYASTTTGGVWSTNGRASISQSGAATGTSAGSTSIVYTITNTEGCSAKISLPVTVYTKPATPTMSFARGTTGITGNGGYCTNKIFRLIGNPVGGVWSSSGTLSITNAGDVTTASTTGSGSVTYTITDANGCNNFRSNTANVVACRGINSLAIDNNQFIIYPNPLHSVINLKVNKLIGAGSIVITDLYGKQLKQQALSLGINTIDVSNFAKGMYLVSIITEQGKQTQKVVVE